MEYKTTLEIVTKDIQDIEKLVSNFKNYSRIPNIELDLALSRLRNVYDLLLMFKADGESNPVREVPVADKKSADPMPVAETPVTSKHETVNAAPSEPKEIIADLPQKPAPAAPEVEKTTENLKVGEEKKFVNEKLGEQNVKKDISSKHQAQPIKSIAGSLGINDKFYFIRELFAGNAELFRQTMADLDESHNFNDAFTLLINRFQWDMESEPVQMLLNLVRRKFITSSNE